MSTPTDRTKTEALRRIAAITNANDPESYRNDDAYGALDTVHALAVEALREDTGIKELVAALRVILATSGDPIIEAIADRAIQQATGAEKA